MKLFFKYLYEKKKASGVVPARLTTVLCLGEKALLPTQVLPTSVRAQPGGGLRPSALLPCASRPLLREGDATGGCSSHSSRITSSK